MIEINITPTELILDQVNELTIILTNIGRRKYTNIICKLTLPVQMVLLQGSDRIEVPYLEANQNATFIIRVRPKSIGNWIITSTNFSYRDWQGQSQRIFDLRRTVKVIPMADSIVIPEPQLSIKLDTTDLPLGEWEMLAGHIINTGFTALNYLAIKISGLVTTAPGSDWQELGPLLSKGAVAFQIPVIAGERGSKVPINIELSYVDIVGRRGQLKTATTLQIGKSPINTAASEPRITILFLSADPTDASYLRLGEEFREIQEKLKLAKLRERFILELPQLSIRPTDIGQALLDTQPQIVHFSGHGISTGALCFEDQIGETHLVQADALAALFEQFANQIECVLLNACYSKIQAQAIAKHIEYVIGMNQAISDKAAIAFTVGFYQALGAGRSIEDAYKLGCVQIRLQGISEHLTPVFIKS
ncbi:MAG: CHAT domain-containing protein [Acidobacteriota bacterium]